tara:strand:+ start:7150 stop:8880 length:1731 start_codon:yes stop_codon:yes gene_type:complete
MYETLKNIINNTELTPTIINKDSDFVIITYWWGRGNKNKNTQKPCPDEVEPGQKLDNEPIQFEEMIENWVKSCKKMKCNYLAQEYPEFAVKGGYQMAINAKPLFIKKALQSCKGRAVVYIDGDMTVNSYPHIFNMKNIDFMARGWNIDPRGNKHYLSKTKSICFDPYIFETSGGIMYFADSIPSNNLLDLWAKASHKKMFEGKADDRILSMLITSMRLDLKMNIMQLPIEYLWLTDNYSPENVKDRYLNKSHYNKKDIVFEHPACLTSEEKALELGAANDRQPKFYDKLLENVIECETEGGIFWEYIIFEEKRQLKQWSKYLNYISKAILYKDDEGEKIHPYYTVKYNDVYGKYNKIAEENVKKAKKFIVELGKYKIKGDYVYLKYDDEMKYKSNVVYSYDLIPTILALHYIGVSVIYLPNDCKDKDVDEVLKLKEKNKTLELITKITNENSFEFNKSFPIYLCCKSRVLNHIIKMSENIEDINKKFRLCVLFVQLIRSEFIIDYGSSSTKSSTKSSKKSSSKSPVKKPSKVQSLPTRLNNKNELLSEIKSMSGIKIRSETKNIKSLVSLERKIKK